MDTAGLAASLDDLRQKVTASSMKEHWAYYYLHKAGETRSLEQALAGQPDLAEFSGAMRTLGNSASPVNVEGLARSLVARAVEADTATALSELERYVECSSFAVIFTLAVAGIRVEGPTELGNGIRIIPYSETEFLPWPSDDRSGSATTARISAAFVKDFDHPKLYHDQTVTVDPRMADTANQLFGELEHARLCVGLIKPSMSMEIGRCVQLPARIPICGPFCSQSWVVNQLAPQPLQFTKNELDLARHTHVAFCQMTPKMRDRLVVPMSRLQKAMFNHFPTVDDLIDLGIAVEATFLGDNEKDEITFKLAIRGARLLGSDAAERKQIKDLLTSVYRARSIAVHRGVRPDRVPSPSKHPTLRDLFLDGCAQTARALRVIIERNGVDWEDVVLT